MRLDDLDKMRFHKLEPWLMLRRWVLLFCAVGTACALLFSIYGPAFSDSYYSFIHTILILAGLGFAIVIAIRLLILMKLETGPRSLDLPRLSTAILTALTIFLPAIVLQIGYPVRLLISHHDVNAQSLLKGVTTVRSALGARRADQAAIAAFESLADSVSKQPTLGDIAKLRKEWPPTQGDPVADPCPYSDQIGPEICRISERVFNLCELQSGYWPFNKYVNQYVTCRPPGAYDKPHTYTQQFSLPSLLVLVSIAITVALLFRIVRLSEGGSVYIVVAAAAALDTVGLPISANALQASDLAITGWPVLLVWPIISIVAAAAAGALPNAAPDGFRGRLGRFMLLLLPVVMLSLVAPSRDFSITGDYVLDVLLAIAAGWYVSRYLDHWIIERNCRPIP